MSGHTYRLICTYKPTGQYVRTLDRTGPVCNPRPLPITRTPLTRRDEVLPVH